MPAQCLPLPAALTEPTPIPLPPGLVGLRLKYGQSVQWNGLLLAALESANRDKAAIREAEQRRTEETQNVKSGAVEENH